MHHIAGHIYANSLVRPLQFPLLALVVSGGHTELVEMTKHYKFKKLGGTLDDAIGECYDKVARVIGLEYPGGPKVDKLAQVGKDSYKLPIPLHDDSYNFSGKTIVPFMTNGGLGHLDIVATIKSLEPEAKVFDGINISGREVTTAEEAVIQMIKEVMGK